jgi:hypothetical protein
VFWPIVLAVRYWGWPAFITARYGDVSILAVVLITAVGALIMLSCGVVVIAYFARVVIWIKNKAIKRQQ